MANHKLLAWSLSVYADVEVLVMPILGDSTMVVQQAVNLPVAGSNPALPV